MLRPDEQRGSQSRDLWHVNGPRREVREVGGPE